LQPTQIDGARPAVVHSSAGRPSFFVLCVRVAEVILQLAFCSFVSVYGLRARQVFDELLSRVWLPISSTRRLRFVRPDRCSTPATKQQQVNSSDITLQHVLVQAIKSS
jgi:hypothetical protein